MSGFGEKGEDIPPRRITWMHLVSFALATAVLRLGRCFFPHISGLGSSGCLSSLRRSRDIRPTRNLDGHLGLPSRLHKLFLSRPVAERILTPAVLGLVHGGSVGA
jgi:hypothetical protein